MSAAASTIHIVEDEPAVLRSIIRLLSSLGHDVRGYRSSEEFLANGATDGEGCIVMDLCLPGMTGLDLQQYLLANGCAHPIVFITGKADVPASVRAMRAGALNFLLKPVDAEELIDSVHEALHVNAMARRRRESRALIEQRLARLTPREQEVFHHVVSGLMNKQIAVQMGVGEKTVKVHRGRVMHKMEAQSVAQLVRMAGQIRPQGDFDAEDLQCIPLPPFHPGAFTETVLRS